jgi:DNA repair exonuclease SbcCD ATPase subunit
MEDTPMTERRKTTAARAPAKIKQLEARLAQVEADLARVRSTAARGGLTRVRLAGIEKAMAQHVARAQAGLRDSVNRLSRTLLSARSRKEAAQQIAQARQGVKESLDRLGRTLGESQKKITREVSLLTRGLKAGVKAGRAAYRGPRG